ncbi:uncharacterized protein LOC119335994 [Triticum dicoccoides]|uniref:uncharacterized protein LOC119335994 n=1 Tax=Triticum dicoccoides TaxID=85692 RepID=UPI00084304BC|nr:uncharacterized protein LOC119335994 [Triticum dicoccoides]XP_044431891.1 uncharacterized protein LOC123157721 [Triticum aestivum]
MPPSPAPCPVVVLSDDESSDDGAASDAVSRSAAERIASTLTTQAAVDALCKNHDVPRGFAARPAGELRARSAPPRGSVCVYAHMLETGVRFPLHGFFCEALTHFHLAPGQLSINGWRVLVGFVALCHEADVRPSMALLRHFFKLYNRNDWYYFRCRADAGVLFTGTSYSQSEREWKGGFFFLTSAEEWRCPVRWGEPPYKSSAAGPVLTSQQKQSAEKLLGVHGTARDLRAYLRETDLAAALPADLAGAPPPPQPSPRSTVSQGMYSPARDMTDSMPGEKTAAPAARTEQVKSEAHGDTLPLSGNKRRREEVTATDGHDGAATVSNPRAPSGFDPRSPRSPVPDTHDGDSADWKAAQKILEGLVTPSRERHFAASKPSDVVASSYVAVLQAANYATFSMTYALELDEKVVARERDNLALWEQVEKEKAARQAAEAELQKVKAELESAEATAVQQFLGSEEYTRRLAVHALPAYLRGAEEMRRVVLRHYPHVDAGKLELPLD